MFDIPLFINLFISLIELNQGNISTLNQPWNNVDRQHSSTLFQRWYLVENESWADVCLSTLFQRWQNNVETTLKELRRFNVDDPMLFHCWYLVEKESWFNLGSSALGKQHWNNFVNICCTCSLGSGSIAKQN